MGTKLDYLKECNDQSIPLDDFKMAFCDRCFQKECSRSQFGTSRFEQRVGRWQERMFQPPALPKNDPRYPAIIAKKFLNLATGPTPSIQAKEWVDPKTLEQPVIQTVPELVKTPDPPPVEVIREPPPVVPPLEAKAKPVPEPKIEVPEPKIEAPKPPPALQVPPPVQQKPTTQPQKPIPLMNTPYTEPRTLGNQPVEQPRDPWATPEPLKPGERVVSPGARIKIQR